MTKSHAAPERPKKKFEKDVVFGLKRDSNLKRQTHINICVSSIGHVSISWKCVDCTATKIVTFVSLIKYALQHVCYPF